MEKVLYSGTCRGGPLDGRAGYSRFPKGFVLVDKPNNAVWVYDYDSDTSTFTMQDRPTYLNRAKAWIAAQESDYDVRALDA